MEDEMESMERCKNMYFLTEAQMHMERWKKKMEERMSFIVTFGEKGKSKYMGGENDVFFNFSKCDF